MIDRRNAEQAAERLMLSYVKECKCTTLDEASIARRQLGLGGEAYAQTDALRMK